MFDSPVLYCAIIVLIAVDIIMAIYYYKQLNRKNTHIKHLQTELKGLKDSEASECKPYEVDWENVY